MRCAKCNYISFDYNTICPKCNRDLKDVQILLNLPDFQPSPPSFLGMMLGEENDSSANLEIGLPSHINEIEHDDEIRLGASDDLLTEESSTETGEPELQLSFDSEEPEVDEEIEELDFISDFSEKEIREPKAEEMVLEPLSDEELGLEEEISRNVEDISLEFDDEELLSVDEEIQEIQVSGLDHEIEKSSLDEEPVSLPKTDDQPLDLELDSITLDLENLSAEVEIDDQDVGHKITEDKDADDFLLELDDLTIDELESDDKAVKEEQPYEESEMVTKEIDRSKFNTPDDEGKND